jgi:hypothetical protein
MNELMNDEAVYRTALATPGLLNRQCHSDREVSNSQRHQNPISGSKVTAILLKGLILSYWWSFIGKGLRLHPAQQACL